MAETSYQTSSPYFKEDVTKLINKGWDYTDKPYERYNGDRVADFSSNQESAFDLSKSFADDGLDKIGAYGDAGAQSISFDRLVDEGGSLGSIQDYLNPYLSSSLEPTLDEIRRGGEIERNQIGSMATMSGAYGDARHGILEAEQRRGENKNLADFTNQAYRDAFDRAMSYRQGDQAKSMEAQTFNANAVERALDRLLKSGEAGTATGMKQIQTLLSTGGLQRNKTQAELDAEYEEHLREQDEEIKDLNTMQSILSGSSAGTGTSTITQAAPQPSSGGGLFGTIGGLIDSIF